MTAELIILHPSSPFFHPSGVKEVGSVKCSYTETNNYSPYMFHPFTPTPPRDARTRVFACVREGVGERGKEVLPALISAGRRNNNQDEKETV